MTYNDTNLQQKTHIFSLKLGFLRLFAMRSKFCDEYGTSVPLSLKNTGSFTP